MNYTPVFGVIIIYIKDYIDVYLDANIIQLWENCYRDLLYQFARNNLINLLMFSAVLEDINLKENQIGSLKAEKQVKKKKKIIAKLFNPVAEIELNNSFDDHDIAIFKILFPNKPISDISKSYNNLKVNDKNDYRIIKNCKDYGNNYSFFITNDATDFIKNDTKQKLESYFKEKLRKSLYIGLLSKKTITKIEFAISDVEKLINKNQL